MATTTTPVSYKAQHRFARISVRKLRPILDLIRNKFRQVSSNPNRANPKDRVPNIDTLLPWAQSTAAAGEAR